MTNAWFLGATQSVPQSENEVRSTVEPVRSDGPAEAHTDPDFGQVQTDNSGELVGLSPRQLAGDTHDSVKYRPWWANGASVLYNFLIDRQVASSGTAAAREEAGEQGHGTMQYQVSVEPELRDGMRFGNDYFVVNDRDIQNGMGSYMSPITSDKWPQAVAQSRATSDARAANQSTIFDAFLNG